MSTQTALILSLIIVAVASRLLWPFARCRSCRGSGQSPGSNRRRWGTCGRCGGSGTRRRFGARRD